jgi:hypothetical protein
MARQPPSGTGPPRCRGFAVALRHTTLDRTLLDGRTARRRDLYLITRNTYNRQTSMPSTVFEPTVTASERPRTHTLDRELWGLAWNDSTVDLGYNVNKGTEYFVSL